MSERFSPFCTMGGQAGRQLCECRNGPVRFASWGSGPVCPRCSVGEQISKQCSLEHFDSHSLPRPPTRQALARWPVVCGLHLHHPSPACPGCSPFLRTRSAPPTLQVSHPPGLPQKNRGGSFDKRYTSRDCEADIPGDGMGWPGRGDLGCGCWEAHVTRRAGGWVGGRAGERAVTEYA